MFLDCVNILEISRQMGIPESSASICVDT